jgi:hypothetical protein
MGRQTEFRFEQQRRDAELDLAIAEEKNTTGGQLATRDPGACFPVVRFEPGKLQVISRDVRLEGGDQSEHSQEAQWNSPGRLSQRIIHLSILFSPESLDQS